MSGIVGIFNFDGRPVGCGELREMNAILSHRGPDGSRLWCDGTVGLGHQMLHTTPQSLREVLPLVNRSANLAITADARIDNREELIVLLDLNHRSSAEITDSQIILAAYEKWGDHSPERLLGSFAFAVWDGRQRSLFCARDHMGTKPFYYYRSEATFIFGSEIKAVLSRPDVPHKLNEVRVAEYLASVFDDKTITFYAGIVRLAPGHSLNLSSDRVHLQSYWSLDPSRELRLGSDEAYAEAFREIFIKAVVSSARSAFPAASCLSGGLDSSAVSCVAQKMLDQNGGSPLRTLSIVFDEVTQCDERPFIDKVLARGGFEAHYVGGDRIGPLENISSMLWHQDEPFYAPGLFSTWELFRAARDQGVRVLLDGHDGDGTVSHGHGRLNELAQAGQWIALTVEANGLSKVYGSSLGGILWSYLRHYKLDPLIANSSALSRIQHFSQALCQRVRRDNAPSDHLDWKSLVSPDFARRIDLAERCRTWAAVRPRGVECEREMHYRTVVAGLQPFALEVFDKAAAAFSIDIRHPFWDKRLVEFCLSLPAEQKLSGGWSRVILRRALGGFLPREIQWRIPKTDFLPSFSHGLFVRDQDRLEKIILGDLEVIEGYVDILALQRLYQQILAQRSRKKLKVEEVLTLWRAVSLVLWLRQIGEKGGGYASP